MLTIATIKKSSSFFRDNLTKIFLNLIFSFVIKIIFEVIILVRNNQFNSRVSKIVITNNFRREICHIS